jgi:hypothetical protein
MKAGVTKELHPADYAIPTSIVYEMIIGHLKVLVFHKKEILPAAITMDNYQMNSPGPISNQAKSSWLRTFFMPFFDVDLVLQSGKVLKKLIGVIRYGCSLLK